MKKKTAPKPAPNPEPKKANHWSDCFLEHAARETVWMREHSKACNYASAHLAQVRREVWLYAALLAKGGKH